MVFEGILESILLNAAGKYITGINQNHLKVGIWSGNVVVENVGLSKNLVKMLNLPLVIKHSSIGKLEL